MLPSELDVGVQFNAEVDYGLSGVAGATQARIDEEIARLESRILQLRRRRNSLSPISQLPVEVLLRVIKNLVPDNLLCINGPIRPQSWIQFTHVCHLWRMVSISDPFLWTRLHVAAMSISWIKAFILRSKSAPLTIIAYAYPQAPISHIQETIFRMPNVLNRITGFHCFERRPSHWIYDLEQLILAHSPLQELTVQYYRQVRVDQTLSLQYLDLGRRHVDSAFISRSLVTLKLQNLETIGLPSISGLYTMLSSLTKLRHLVLDSVLLKMAAKWKSHFSTPSVSIPSLRILELVDEPEKECARMLSHIAFPQLSQLYIYFNKDPTSLPLLNKVLANTWISTRLLANINRWRIPRFTFRVNEWGNSFEFYPSDYPGDVTSRIQCKSDITSVANLLTTFPRDSLRTIELALETTSEEDLSVLMPHLSKLPSLDLLVLARAEHPWLYPVFLKSGIPSCSCVKRAGHPANRALRLDASSTACTSCQEFASSFFPNLRSLGFDGARDIMDVDQRLLWGFLCHRTACNRPMDWVKIYCTNTLCNQEEQELVQQLVDMGREFRGAYGGSVDISVSLPQYVLAL
ncbi:hypothetical protein AX16_002854 [Volvariella volvacea WC 439]|nr:hypothetical protein AX16_002854 [Volvariella volvacea WC 439]